MSSEANWKVRHGDYVTKQFQFKDGSSLPELKIHYRTVGTLRKGQNGNSTNVVLLLHGTTGSGAGFFQDSFAGHLFHPSQPLSIEEHFLVIPDSIGHGLSSKPSDGLRAKFPRYCYTDMVRAQHLLLTEHLGIKHVRLILGTSMGAMHTWMWGTMHPEFMDALMPLASLPTQVTGRNRMWRKHAIDSIRKDPGFHGGNFKVPPYGFKAALHAMAWMVSSPLKWQKAAPTREEADKFIDGMIEKRFKSEDPNDFAYAFDASWDYDPRPDLHKIKAPLHAVNSADDQVNPPELRILETEIGKVPGGRAVVLPISDKTNGHGTHLVAESWLEHLVELLERSGRRLGSKL